MTPETHTAHEEGTAALLEETGWPFLASDHGPARLSSNINDLTLAPLQRAAEQLRRQLPAEELPRTFVDHALIARWEVDVRFWGREAQGALAGLPAAVRGPLYQSLSRRIAATFKTDRGRRADLIARLAEGLAIAA